MEIIQRLHLSHRKSIWYEGKNLPYVVHVSLQGKRWCTGRNITDADVRMGKVWFYFVRLSLGAGCLENLREPAAVLAVLSMTTSWQRKCSLRFPLLQPP